MSDNIRVRFAPSPTGPLHIGGLRTALFNYLFAKSQGGTFILRVEDTDQNRFVQGAEDYIKNALAWVGITPDEDPWIGGDFGPYRQSERKGMYAQYAQKLLDSGNAYYAFDSSEELDTMRENLKAQNVANQQYNALTRQSMTNSLTLSEAETKERIDSGKPYVIRFKMPQKEEIRFKDTIRGHVRFHSHTLDDKVLLKSDGMPTYHLANVVDDYLMKITHVIRGEEWLPSAPLHVMLYKTLGWEDSMPQFAHLPLILKPTGKGKLSKRDGAKHGYSVFPLEWKDPETGEISTGFREDGYLPEALINFLALLGWNPGDEREIFSMEELVKTFSMERVNNSGAKFDVDKSKWYNQHYLKAKSPEELGEMLLEELKKDKVDCTLEKATQIAELMRERITFSNELHENAKYFFHAPTEYDAKVAKKKWTQEAVNIFEQYISEIESASDFSAENAKAILEKVLEKNEVGLGRVMQALRLATTGEGGGPDLMPTLSILGKEEVAKRIRTAIEKLEAK
jgi:glutamyl-tRNA synthetase